jgi:chaperone modulatory protein CbpM
MTKQEFLSSSGIQVQVLELWLEQRWLVPEEAEAGLLFSEAELARAHLIRQLKDDLGANDEGIDVILHLVDQLHGLRRVLSELREEIKGR